MSFPIEFAKPRGDYDFLSPLINFTGNAAVVAGVATLAAVVAHFALKALGINGVIASVLQAVPVSIATIGGAGIVLGLGAGVAILVYVAKNLRF